MASLASINAELNRLDKQLQDLKATTEEFLVALADRPGDADLTASLEQMEGSEQAIQRQIARLQRSKVAVERRDTVEERAALLARMTGELEGINRAGDKLASLGTSILDKLDALKPLLAEYDEVSRARGLMAHSLLKEGHDQPGPFATAWGRYRREACQRDSGIGLAITAQLWQVFGRGVGAELTQLIDFPGPNQCGPFNEHVDIRETLAEMLVRERDRLQAGIERAFAVVEARDKELEQ